MFYCAWFDFISQDKAWIHGFGCIAIAEGGAWGFGGVFRYCEVVLQGVCDFLSGWCLYYLVFRGVRFSVWVELGVKFASFRALNLRY